jgi:site-specific DNA-methyltransferase (adenine-specific)
MACERFLDDRARLYCGDCRAVLAELPEDRFDSCVTDPPYGISFMNRLWDGGEIAFVPATWCAIFRVLKPGAHLVAFGGTRTYARMAVAIEDAGFEIRDTIAWLYGSGFPKSHSVSKHIDREAGATREIKSIPLGKMNPSIWKVENGGQKNHWLADAKKQGKKTVEIWGDDPVTDAARQWDGWGTALKPAMELIVLARKPLSEGTVAANVLKWGTGAINVDGCRIEAPEGLTNSGDCVGNSALPMNAKAGIDEDRCRSRAHVGGRWPANVTHDGSAEVTAAFPESNGQQGDLRGTEPSECFSGSAARFFFTSREGEASADRRYTDKGATNFAALPGQRREPTDAARFFYTSKAGKDDRISRYVEDVRIEWISESEPCQVVLRVDTEPSHEKDIAVSVSEGDSGWSTFLCGSMLTDLFQKATACTIVTATSSTTESKTWNWLMRLLTSACTADVNYETGNGGSLVASAAIGTRQMTITLGDTVSLPGADRAVSKTPLKISVSGRLHGHPTVKPLDLMQWLVRLVTPPGGLVLDPFAGTGTTAEAAFREGMRAELIEAEPEYQADIRRRMALVLAGPGERARESVKAKNLPRDDGPLFR